MMKSVNLLHKWGLGDSDMNSTVHSHMILRHHAEWNIHNLILRLTKYFYFFQASFHQTTIEGKFGSFPTYSREWERYQASLREKEQAWELELMRLMEASTLTATATIATSPTSAKKSNKIEWFR